jgi:hypothetical protein
MIDNVKQNFISKPNMSPVMVNCPTESKIIQGKNGTAIFKNEWLKANDIEDCSWREMAKLCRVKGGY